MSRKKKHPEHVNHERWLISYADFITLLFAFFVVMFAVSQVDSNKVGRFTESFSKAVGIDTFPESGAGLLPGGAIPSPTPDATRSVLVLAPELESLKTDLVTARKKSELPPKLQILQRRNELVIRLSESLFFALGDDRPKEASVNAMRLLAAQLAARKVDVRVEGHTDDLPIHTSRFRSNWELSTARATAVVAILAQGGIAPERLSAAGYGEFHPITPNTSAETRAQNRRVDIVVGAAAPEEPDTTKVIDDKGDKEKSDKGDKPAERGDGDKPTEGEKGDKPAEHGANGDKPAEHGDKPAEHGDEPAEHGDKPAAHGSQHEEAAPAHGQESDGHGATKHHQP